MSVHKLAYCIVNLASFSDWLETIVRYTSFSGCYNVTWFVQINVHIFAIAGLRMALSCLIKAKNYCSFPYVTNNVWLMFICVLKRNLSYALVYCADSLNPTGQILPTPVPIYLRQLQFTSMKYLFALIRILNLHRQCRPEIGRKSIRTCEI